MLCAIRILPSAQGPSPPHPHLPSPLGEASEKRGTKLLTTAKDRNWAEGWCPCHGRGWTQQEIEVSAGTLMVPGSVGGHSRGRQASWKGQLGRQAQGPGRGFDVTSARPSLMAQQAACRLFSRLPPCLWHLPTLLLCDVVLDLPGQQ